jgi:exopolysaccharide biosynthesis protein
LQTVTFDARSHRLRLIDQPQGPGTLFASAEAAAKSVHGMAAINAGYFTPEGKPLGILICRGKKIGGNNPSSLGSAVWFEAKGKTGIIRREKTNFNAPELLQAGPLLAENSQAIAGLENNKTSARCFLAWDGGSMWMIARTSPCTLAQLSAIIAGQSPCGFPITTALNLDGGTSADLYVSGDVVGGPTSYRAIWNKPVRNFLVLEKR